MSIRSDGVRGGAAGKREERGGGGGGGGGGSGSGGGGGCGVVVGSCARPVWSGGVSEWLLWVRDEGKS